MSCTRNTFTSCILTTIPDNAESLSPQQSSQEDMGKSWHSVETCGTQRELGKHEGLTGRSRPEEPSKNVHEAQKWTGPSASRAIRKSYGNSSQNRL